jgi:adenylate cyclase
MRPEWKQRVLPAIATVLLALIASGAVMSGRRAGWLRGLEFQVYDMWMRQRPDPKPLDYRCVIVGVSDADQDAWGQTEISDKVLADLIQKLRDAGAACIGVDIVRDRVIRDEKAGIDDSQRLYDMIRDDTGPYVLIPLAVGGTLERAMRLPRGFAPDDDHVAAVNIAEDHDGVIRRGLLAISDAQGQGYLTMAAKLAAIRVDMDMDHSKPGDARPFFRFGKTEFVPFAGNDGSYVNEPAGGFTVPLDFRGPQRFQRFSVQDVLSGHFPTQWFKGRVVLIGVCAKGVKDYVTTSLRARPEEFGVEYHARLTDMLIRAARGGDVKVKFWSDRGEAMWVLLFCVIGAGVALSARPPGRLFAGATGMSVSCGLAAAVLLGLWFGSKSAFERNWWIPVIPAAAGFLLSTGMVSLYTAVIGRRDRNAMMQLISHAVSDDVAKLIWAERDQVFESGRLRSRRLRGTVLFTDLRGFSGIAEQLPAAQLMSWLNEYYQGISDLVKQCRGSILKFNGDQIVAVFGPPRMRTRPQAAIDARNAVVCALRMRDELVKLNAQWRGQNRPEAQMRVGIHTGWLVAGSLGSRQRAEWSVIGDTVNTASRLESVSKDLMPPDIAANGCRILISDATARLLDLTFDIRRLGRLRLRGKRRRVVVHGVKGLLSGSPPANPTTVDQLTRHKDGT